MFRYLPDWLLMKTELVFPAMGLMESGDLSRIAGFVQADLAS